MRLSYLADQVVAREVDLRQQSSSYRWCDERIESDVLVACDHGLKFIHIRGKQLLCGGTVRSEVVDAVPVKVGMHQHVAASGNPLALPGQQCPLVVVHQPYARRKLYAIVAILDERRTVEGHGRIGLRRHSFSRRSSRSGRDQSCALTVQGALPRETDFEQSLCADISGFSLHAAVRCGADDRQALEQLCRYITRPALANGPTPPDRWC